MACTHCEKPSVFARGLCQACYYRLRRNGSLERKNVVNKGSCSIDGCSNAAFSRNLCQKHYDQAEHPMKHTWKILRSRAPQQYPPSWDRFESFLADIGERPGPRFQLRRKDADQAWSTTNFRWVEPVERVDPMGDRRNEYERAWRFKNKFGITTDEYDAMFKAQDGKCAICAQSSKQVHRKTGKVRDLAVDHCHDTGKVRALLCTDCNMALGLFKDDPDLLSAAADYLRAHRKPRLVCDNGEAA